MAAAASFPIPAVVHN